MKTPLKLLTALVIFSTPFTSFADELGFYTGANYSYVETDDWSVSALEGIGGFKFSPNLAFELQLGAGVTDDDLAPGVDVSVDHYVSAFFKPQLPLGDTKIYALLGHSTIKASTEGDVNISDTDDGFAYGVGASYYFADLMSVNAEFKHLGEDVDAISVGFSYEF